MNGKIISFGKKLTESKGAKPTCKNSGLAPTKGAGKANIGSTAKCDK